MSKEAEAAALEVLHAYMAAWNAADLEAYRSTLNYPFLTLGTEGQVALLNSPEEMVVDFERLRAVEGWDHSTLDSYNITMSCPTKVNIEIVFSRYRPDGTVYGTGRTLYIFTKMDGHWGMQFRSGMPDAALAAAMMR